MNEKSIIRKVRTRLFFYKCSGKDKLYDFRSEKDLIPLQQTSTAIDPEVIDTRIDEAYKKAEEAAVYAFQNGYWHLSGRAVSVFFKRALRKLLKIFWGWYLNPIFERQSTFNGKIYESVSLSVINASEQNKKIAELTNKVDELTCRINELTQKLDERTTEHEKIHQICNDIASAPYSVKYYQKLIGYISEKLNIMYDPALIENDLIDYFEFENWFRGTREEIKSRQEQYIPYLKTDYQSGYVLDIGCGRGELLELMKSNGIIARGVDCYAPFVKFNKDRGYDVQLGDALTVLAGQEDDSLNGITMCQIAEHINNDYLCQLIRTGYKKLRKGCCFIIETPNPQALATYANFYVDGSHLKPVHFDMLNYLFAMSNYKQITRLSNEYSEHPYHSRVQEYIAGKCTDDNSKKIIEDINDLMFKSLDYTIIARK